MDVLLTPLTPKEAAAARAWNGGGSRVPINDVGTLLEAAGRPLAAPDDLYLLLSALDMKEDERGTVYVERDSLLALFPRGTAAPAPAALNQSAVSSTIGDPSFDVGGGGGDDDDILGIMSGSDDDSLGIMDDDDNELGIMGDGDGGDDSSDSLGVLDDDDNGGWGGAMDGGAGGNDGLIDLDAALAGGPVEAELNRAAGIASDDSSDSSSDAPVYRAGDSVVYRPGDVAAIERAALAEDSSSISTDDDADGGFEVVGRVGQPINVSDFLAKREAAGGDAVFGHLEEHVARTGDDDVLAQASDTSSDVDDDDDGDDGGLGFFDDGNVNGGAGIFDDGGLGLLDDDDDGDILIESDDGMGIMDEDEYGAGVFAGGAEARPAGIFDADPGRHSVVDDHVMAAIHAHAAAGGGDAAVLLHDPADDDIDDFDDHPVHHPALASASEAGVFGGSTGIFASGALPSTQSGATAAATTAATVPVVTPSGTPSPTRVTATAPATAPASHPRQTHADPSPFATYAIAQIDESSPTRAGVAAHEAAYEPALPHVAVGDLVRNPLGAERHVEDIGLIGATEHYYSSGNTADEISLLKQRIQVLQDNVASMKIGRETAEREAARLERSLHEKTLAHDQLHTANLSLRAAVETLQANADASAAAARREKEAVVAQLDEALDRERALQATDTKLKSAVIKMRTQIGEEKEVAKRLASEVERLRDQLASSQAAVARAEAMAADASAAAASSSSAGSPFRLSSATNANAQVKPSRIPRPSGSGKAPSRLPGSQSGEGSPEDRAAEAEAAFFDLTQAYEEQEAALVRLQAKHRAVRAELQEVQAERGAEAQEASGHLARLSDLEDKNYKLVHQARSERAKREALETELESISERYQRLQVLEEKARVGKDKVTRAADRMKARLGELEQENEVVRGESQRVAALALKLEKRLAKAERRSAVGQKDIDAAVEARVAAVQAEHQEAMDRTVKDVENRMSTRAAMDMAREKERAKKLAGQVENLKRRLSNKKQTADHDARELGSSVAELSADVADLTERNAALEDKYRALTLKSKKTIKGLQMKVELTKDELAKESEKAQSLEILVETLRRTSSGAGGGGGVAAGAEESQKRLLVELRRANEEMGRMDVALESRTEEIGALKAERAGLEGRLDAMTTERNAVHNQLVDLMAALHALDAAPPETYPYGSWGRVIDLLSEVVFFLCPNCQGEAEIELGTDHAPILLAHRAALGNEKENVSGDGTAMAGGLPRRQEGANDDGKMFSMAAGAVSDPLARSSPPRPTATVQAPPAPSPAEDLFCTRCMQSVPAASHARHVRDCGQPTAECEWCGHQHAVTDVEQREECAERFDAVQRARVRLSQIAPVVGLRVATSRGGCLVDYVHPNGPSMEAGLEEGDVVVAVGSTVVQTKDDFGTAVKRWCFPGQAVTIRAIRQQHNKTFRLVVGAKGMSMEEYHALGALVDDWEEFARQEY